MTDIIWGTVTNVIANNKFEINELIEKMRIRIDMMTMRQLFLLKLI